MYRSVKVSILPYHMAKLAKELCASYKCAYSFVLLPSFSKTRRLPLKGPGLDWGHTVLTCWTPTSDICRSKRREYVEYSPHLVSRSLWQVGLGGQRVAGRGDARGWPVGHIPPDREVAGSGGLGLVGSDWGWVVPTFWP